MAITFHSSSNTITPGVKVVYPFGMRIQIGLVELSVKLSGDNKELYVTSNRTSAGHIFGVAHTGIPENGMRRRRVSKRGGGKVRNNKRIPATFPSSYDCIPNWLWNVSFSSLPEFLDKCFVSLFS